MERNRTRRRHRDTGSAASPAQRLVAKAGQYTPLSPDQVNMIDHAARTILGEIGFADAPKEVIDLLSNHGASLNEHGRLHIPEHLVDAATADLPRQFTLHGRKADQALSLGCGHVYLGSGGASPQILSHDADGNAHYAASTLADLHHAARIVDALPHIDFFARSLVAGDMPNADSLDLNTAYACFHGTSKPVLTSAASVASARAVIEMASLIAGSAEALRDTPFFGFNINHVVPPLRFDPESCLVLITAAQAGIPVMVNTFGQLGASSPVTMAGCLAQTMAETLAGMVIVWAANPHAPAVFGPRPMITDLRTGGMAGGSGEQALLTAASAQMARHYGWPSSTIAGATESKTLDIQSGYEKAVNVSLAVAAGIDLVTQAAGAQASLMAASLEGYVIDNDMLGVIKRSSQNPQVDEDTLSLDDIRAVVAGEGHFLGREMTMARMMSDFTYPQIADRSSPEEWMIKGQPSQIAYAREHAVGILEKPQEDYITADIDALIRNRFEISLPPTD